MSDDSALAIIGVAFEFPCCDDWDGLTALLGQGRDTMRPLPRERAEDTGAGTSDADRDGGWIDDITGFDHRYFGLSMAEAELIDPRQRRMLELARQAIGDAGYAPAELAGGDVAVLVAGYGGPHPSLFNLLSPEDRRAGPAATGSLHAYAAGRLAYHLDLRGAAQVLDTSCSSFLVALHEARWKLARGESDLALVGGYELVLGDPPRHGPATDGLGVLSAADRCRPFDQAADGTTYGEGGGFVLVKRLADALADRDAVYAVIRGSALNQDAGRSTGLTVPSPVAQAAVIAAAVRDARLPASAIGYVEAHGTGTRIGDPIEIQGLVEGYRGRGSAAGPVVSSVKANLGHLGCMAGFAGLVRIIAQFRAGEIFPTAHFGQPNPLLNLDGAPLRIAARREPWPAGGGPRYAAISSFGLSGTNAHMIVEEGVAVGTPPDADEPALTVVALSAKDGEELRHQAKRLRDDVRAEAGEFDLTAAANVLTAGREHFSYRHAWVVRDAKDLLGRLDEAVDGATPDPCDGARPAAIALGDVGGVSLETLRESAGTFAGFARAMTDAAIHVPATDWTPRQRGLIWLLGAYAVIADSGVSPAVLLTHGLGVTAARVLQGTERLSTALATPAAVPSPPDAGALRAALGKLGVAPVLVDFAAGSELSRSLPERAPATTPAEALRALYLAGHDVNWCAVLGTPRKRLHLPVARLRRERCWPALPRPVPGTAPAPADTEAATTGSTEEIVLGLARAVLKEPGLTPGDDFFDVGGNSLNGAQLVARINERFGTDLDAIDLFDFADFAAIAAAVADAAGEPEQPSPARARDDGAESGPLSGQQLAIWAAHHLDPEAGTYNVPAALLLGEPADIPALTGELRSIAARHPMLRASVVDGPGGPRQVVAPAPAVRLSEVELDLTGVGEAEGRPALLAGLRGLVAEPLSPYTSQGRYQLVHARFADRTRDVLLLTFHHLFVDGWSWRLLFADLGDAHAATSVPARHYLDYVADQRALLDGPAGQRLTDFWTGQLDGARYVPLPADEGGDDRNAGHGELALPLDGELTAGLRELARQHRCTPNMLLLAAWITVLWRITGEPDVTVAVPAAGRRPADEPVVGNYATTLLVRVRVQPDEPFATLLATVRDASLATLAHQEMPTDRLRRIARPQSTEPLAASMFTYNSDVEPVVRLGADGPGVELLDVGQGASAFPVSVSLLEYGDSVRGRLQYDTGLFRHDTVRGWLSDYEVLLNGLAAQGTGARLTALVAPAVPAQAPGHVAPSTEREARLCALWSRHLRRDPVGVHDDFLDLGGDSISAIAIAAEAGAHGLPVRPRQILDLRTVAAVAAAVDEAGPAAGSGEHAPVAAAGEAEAAPPQLEFLARGVPCPDHWNHGVRYVLTRPVPTGEVEQALRELARRHPALRARLRRTGDSWAQTVSEDPPPVTEFELTGTGATEFASRVDALATNLHVALNLADGPVCRAGLFRLPCAPDELVLVIHHAMVDLYSWNIITDELSALLDGGPLAPPPPGYPAWAARLADHVRREPGRLDGSYWLDRTWSGQLRPVPAGSFGVEGNTGELRTEFEAPGAVPGVTRYARLLAAFGAAVQHRLGVRGGEVAVHLVGHGREELFDDLPLDRTVGYFNTTYPFALGLPGRRDRSSYVSFVARELDSVPRGGFDFEALRRWHPDPLVRRQLADIPAPTVLFSFWGTPSFLDAGKGGGTLTGVRTDLVGLDRPAGMPRSCALEIYPSLHGDRIRVQWRYSGELLTPEAVGALAAAFERALRNDLD